MASKWIILARAPGCSRRDHGIAVDVLEERIIITMSNRSEDIGYVTDLIEVLAMDTLIGAQRCGENRTADMLWVLRVRAKRFGT